MPSVNETGVYDILRSSPIIADSGKSLVDDIRHSISIVEIFQG